MPRFRFQLQPVLQQREAVERQKQLDVAAIERERLALEREIRECQEMLTRERDSLRDAVTAEKTHGGVDMRGVRLQAAAALRHTARANQAVVKLAGVHRRLDAARVALLQATAQRKAVELLNQRRYEQWLLEQKRREAGAMDELHVMAARAPHADLPETAP